MLIQRFSQKNLPLTQFFVCLWSRVPHNLWGKCWRKPMKFWRINLYELWHRPHKSHIISFLIDLSLFDRTKINLLLWDLCLPLFINKISYYIFDFALGLLINLGYSKECYLWQIHHELLFNMLDLWTIFEDDEGSLLSLVQDVHLHFGVLN